MTSSFSSGVWSRGTITSALVKFCSSFTWSKQQGSRFCWGRAKILCCWCCPSSEPGHGTRLPCLALCLSPWDGCHQEPPPGHGAGTETSLISQSTWTEGMGERGCTALYSQGRWSPHTPTYRLATFADDTASGEGRHLDVGFELHFFFWVKEVFLFQLPKYSPLGLERAQKGHRCGGQHPGGGLQAMMCQCPAAPKPWSQAEEPPWHNGDQRDALTMSPPMSPSQPRPCGHRTLN